MKFAVALALAVLATPSQAWDRGCIGGSMPPSEMVGVLPTVEYYAVTIAPDIIRELCEQDWGPVNRAPLGCVNEERPGEWYIYINSDQSMAEQLCTLWHERAHLPPFSWEHPYYTSGPAYHSRRDGVADVLRRLAEDPR